MAPSLLMCFLLVETLMGLALASEKVQTLVQPNSDLPSETPTTSGLAFKLVRKLGNHMEESVSLVAPPIHGLSIAPNSQQEHEGVHGGDGSSTGSRESASSDHEMDIAPGQQQEVHQEHHHHHHSMDKSVAGGGVILGGLATTFLVAIFCYIRATGRDKPDAISKV